MDSASKVTYVILAATALAAGVVSAVCGETYTWKGGGAAGNWNEEGRAGMVVRTCLAGVAVAALSSAAVAAEYEWKDDGYDEE